MLHIELKTLVWVFQYIYIYILNIYYFILQGDSGGPLLDNNEVIAVNGGTFPRPHEDVHPGKVNLHFSVNFYKNFILDILNNY
jgi:hypothetical protein